MRAFIEELMSLPLSGIPAKHWQRFLQIFADGAKDSAIDRGIANIRKAAEEAGLTQDKLDEIEKFLTAARALYEAFTP